LGETSGTSARSKIFLVLTNLVSIACLVWSLRGVRLGELKDDIATMNWWWVSLAVGADLAIYLWQGWRWSLLLRPVFPVKFWQTVRAIYVGLFANEILPFRAGEVVRCYLLSRWTTLPFSVTLSSFLIERIFDGIWLCSCLLVMLKFMEFPKEMGWLVDSGYVLGMFVLLGAALLGLALFRRHQTRAALSPTSWQRHLRVLIDDLSLIGHSRFLYFAFGLSLPYLLLQVIPIYAAFKGYGFEDLTLGQAFALMMILRLGSVVPQGPANLGIFQVLTMECLVKIFNVVPNDAARFAQVLWGIVTLPLLIAGLVALTITGARIGELRRAANAETSEMSKSR
jgi:hypothetical protein